MGVTLRKISTFCRFSGIFCLAFFACYLFFEFGGATAHAQIKLPEKPVEQPPPQAPRLDPRLLESRDQRKKSEETARQKIQAETSKAEAQKAKESLLKSRQFAGFSELSMSIGKALVSEGRSNYHLDPSIHFSSYIRSIWRDEPRDLQGWYGLRIAPFAGYGTQKGLTARFAHTWMGPAIGLGKITFEDDRLGPAATSYVTLLSGGIAGQTRLSGAPDQGLSAGEDFKASAWSLDGSGAWIEFRWYRVTMGSLGFGCLLGTQLGTGKAFTYAGVSASGLY